MQLKVKEQSQRIKTLEKQNVTKQDKIAKQREEIKDLEKEVSRLEKIIQAWQHLWQRLRDFFQNKLFSSKNEDEIYEQVLDEMLEEEILDNEDMDYIQNNYCSHEKDSLER